MEIPYIFTPRKDTGMVNSKIAIWLFLASEVMLFGGFFSSYVYLRLGADYPWPERALPVLPGLINTFVLIFSSVTVVFAWAALKLRKWLMFQISMFITIACAGVFMVLKAIEYNVKFHHQAVRLTDYTILEGHLDKDGKAILAEADQIHISAEKLKFSTVRFHTPWVKEVLRQAEAAPELSCAASITTATVAADGGEVTGQVVVDANLDQNKSGDETTGVNSYPVELLDSENKLVAKTYTSRDANTDGFFSFKDVKAGSYKIQIPAKLATTVFLAEALELQGETVSAGTKLSVELLEKIQKNHLKSRANNASVRTDALRGEWVTAKAKAENAGKKGWELAPNVNIDPAKLEGKLMKETPDVTFTVSPATNLWFYHRDIKEADGQSRLRDDTVVMGKLEESPVAFHNLDAIDFRHVVMKAEEKGIDPVVAIENTWLIKHSKEAKEAWEWNKAQTAKLEQQLIEKYGFEDEAKTKPKRVPTLTERYRIGWKDFVAKADGVDKGKETIATSEEFMGPNYDLRAPKHTFPHLHIPRELVFLSGKFTPAWNTYYAIYFTMTFLHGLHVVGGAIVLGYYLFRGKKMYLSNPEWLAGRVEVGGLFWHFVDLVWIFLFPILYLM